MNKEWDHPNEREGVDEEIPNMEGQNTVTVQAYSKDPAIQLLL
jgi:hypothetical protein